MCGLIVLWRTSRRQSKFANAEQMKVHPAMRDSSSAKRDLEDSAVSVRVHGKGNLGAKPRDETISDIFLAIKERR
jgi:threonyl-tRNA synthetase